MAHSGLSRPRSRNQETQLPQPNDPLHTPTQDAVDLPKMVQVVCRFQADELLDRLPSAYLVDPIALHPPCARDRLQQSQVALAPSRNIAASFDMQTILFVAWR
jgi:hypothetical protein